MRKLRNMRAFALAAVLAVAVIGLGPTADAAVGTGGFTILYAGSGGLAHVCNNIGHGPDGDEAQVCADLTTGQSGSTYWVRATAEAYCQNSAGQPIACEGIADYGSLSVGGGGDDETIANPAVCGIQSQYGVGCLTSRSSSTTRQWMYSVSAGSGGNCSKNEDSAYMVWGLVLGNDNGVDLSDTTEIDTPDGGTFIMGNGQGVAPNDGVNESTGHFYVCPGIA
jgi:hypothetical protein